MTTPDSQPTPQAQPGATPPPFAPAPGSTAAAAQAVLHTFQERSIQPLQGVKVAFLYRTETVMMDDIRDGLKRAGCEIREFVLHETQERQGRGTIGRARMDGLTDFDAYLMTEIDRFDPALILMSSGFGFGQHALLQMVAEVKEIPLVNWLVDSSENFADICFDTQYHYSTNIVFDQYYAEQMRSTGLASVFHLPLATCPQRLAHGLNLQWTCPTAVSFVGTTGLHITDKSWSSVMSMVPDHQATAVRAILEEDLAKAVEALREDPLLNITRFINEHIVPNPERGNFYGNDGYRKTIIGMTEFTASFHLRRDILAAIDAAPVTIIGDYAWKRQLPEGIHLIEGVPFEFISTVYHHSPINLNLSRYQLKTGVTQRVFDVPGAGGFLLTDYRPGLEQLFDLDTEMICFDSVADLNGKIRHYLDHPEDRLGVIEAGRRKVLAEHTYVRRMEQMFFGLAQRGVSKGTAGPGEVTDRPLPPSWHYRLYVLASKLAQYGQEALSEKVFSKIPGWKTEDFDYHGLARDLAERQDFGHCIQVLNDAIATSPKPAFFYDAVVLALHRKVRPMAVEYARRGLEVTPESDLKTRAFFQQVLENENFQLL